MVAPDGGQYASFVLRYVLAAIAMLLALPAGAESFPIGDVFRPLVADPAEPRFFASLLSLDTAADRFTIASLGVGGNFGLRRWPGEQAGEGWQLGIFGAVFSQFSLDAPADDLINTDFSIGLPLAYKRGAFSGRARLWHQSSHLGDELILNGNAPQRIDLSIEAIDLLLAWEHGGWRAYGGRYYLLRGHPHGLRRAGAHAGLDYAGAATVLGGRLVGGVDVKWFDETGWRPGTSVKIGLEFGRPRPQRRGISVLLEAYDGSSPFGQFYRDDITYYGVGLQFDF
jgi:hypothetical protein